jgi:hypothetical protein
MEEIGTVGGGKERKIRRGKEGKKKKREKDWGED